MDSTQTQNQENINALVDFRNEIYQSFPHRADSIMDLIDALAGNVSATSPVELSLSPLFRRQYASVNDAIQNLAPHEQLYLQQLGWQRIIAGHIPNPVDRPFYLFGIDATGYPRPFASTLEDRGANYHPNPVLNTSATTIPKWQPLRKKGLSIPRHGLFHFQCAVFQPHKKRFIDQINSLLIDESLPFKIHLSAVTLDSGYSAVEFLTSTVKHPNLVTIVRLRSNRKFYHLPPNKDNHTEKGHPVWYGDLFDMKDPSTWKQTATTTTIPITFYNGRDATVKIDAWNDLIMRGKQNIPMHQNPFNLFRVSVYDKEGKPVFKRALWLLAMGDRRLEIKPDQVYAAYRQRYDLEHFFRFGKQKLLLNAYQTPDVHHEENWCSIVILAYTQLYLMARLANRLPQPWERYLPNFKSYNASIPASPSIVQRDVSRILRLVGSPACPSKNSPSLISKLFSRSSAK